MPNPRDRCRVRLGHLRGACSRGSGYGGIEVTAHAVLVTGAAIAAAGSSIKAGSIAALRTLGLKDAHHIIQDAVVRDLPGYSSSGAPGVQLPGPANAPGTPHHAATSVERQAGGGTYAAERRIAYKALRAAGLSAASARGLVEDADKFFAGLGVTGSTPTRVPGNRP